jgi:hypothetical protein
VRFLLDEEKWRLTEGIAKRRPNREKFDERNKEDAKEFKLGKYQQLEDCCSNLSGEDCGQRGRLKYGRRGDGNKRKW